MTLVPVLLWALVGLLATGYAHSRLPRYTASAHNVLLLHVVLLTLGIGVGFVMMDRSAADVAALSFVAWFGAVHIPAACILFLKALQRAGKS